MRGLKRRTEKISQRSLFQKGEDTYPYGKSASRRGKIKPENKRHQEGRRKKKTLRKSLKGEVRTYERFEYSAPLFQEEAADGHTVFVKEGAVRRAVQRVQITEKRDTEPSMELSGGGRSPLGAVEDVQFALSARNEK